jgi:flagellar hook-length control protein FliK
VAAANRNASPAKPDPTAAAKSREADQAFTDSLDGQNGSLGLTSGGSSQRDGQQHGAQQAAPVTVVATETHAPPVLALSPVQQIANSIIEAADAASSADEAPQATPAAAIDTGRQRIQPLQTLDIKLEPADLGTVSVKMRLTGSKLDLHIEVTQKDTLPLLHKEGDSLSSQLQSSGYSVDSITIKAAAETGGAAAQQQHSGHGAAQGQPQGQQQPQSQSASLANQRAAGQGGEARSNGRSPSGSGANRNSSSSRIEVTQDGAPQARSRGDLYV